MLFDEKQLFDEGKKRLVHYEIPDAELTLRERFFEKSSSDRFYQVLLKQTPWKQGEREMYGKMVLDPRLTAWYGPDHNEWTAELLEIKREVELACHIQFDSVLLNLYRNGQDSVSWHSDGKPETNRNLVIASVSFGETRPFHIRHKFRKDIRPMEIPLTHGSFLLMAGPMQQYWEHHIPKTSRNINPRINLTFRIRKP